MLTGEGMLMGNQEAGGAAMLLITSTADRYRGIFIIVAV
jgi:hypothetical protein